MRVLWELIWRGYRGRLYRALRLARQPKYAVGTIVGLGYFGWLVARPIFMNEGPSQDFNLDAIAADVQRGLHVLSAIGVALYVSVTWALMPGKPGLRLRDPELHLFLPAPVPRSTLIQFAVLRTLPGIVFGALFLGFFFGTGSLADRVPRALGLLAVFLLWDLHGKGRNLWKMRLRELPAAQAAPRRAVMYAALAAFWIVAAAGLVRVFAAVRDAVAVVGDRSMETWGLALRTLSAESESGWLGILLTPLRWTTAPLVAAEGYPLLPAWIFIIALIVVQYRWVIGAQTRFEETLLAQEQRQAGDPKARARRGLSPRRRAAHVFPLKADAPPELALFWKDLLVITRYPARSIALVFAAGVVLATAAVAWIGLPRLVFQVAAGMMAVFLLFMPAFSGMLWSNGFRRDMRNLEILRTLPVADHRLVLGQILAPIAQSMSLVVLGLGLFIALYVGGLLSGEIAVAFTDEGGGGNPLAGLGIMPWLVPIPVILTVIPYMLGVVSVSSAVECLGVLLLPGWFLGLDDRRGDPSSMGQRIIVGVGFFLVMAVGVLPGALLVFLVILAQRALGIPFSLWELPLLGILAAAPLYLEAFGLVRLAGKLWRGMDPAQEILEGFR